MRQVTWVIDSSLGGDIQVSPVMQILPYFKAYELMDPEYLVVNVGTYLQIHLPYLRHTWGKPLSVNSGCRTPSYNKRIGGHPNSFHLTYNAKYKTDGCEAVDIRTRGWTKEERDDFYNLAKDLGWNIGVADTFIHIDRGQDYGKPFTTWTY